MRVLLSLLLALTVTVESGCIRCADKEVARDGQCVRTCNNDVDCTGTERCLDGECQERGEPPPSSSSSRSAVSGSTSQAVSGVSSGPSSTSLPPSSSSSAPACSAETSSSSAAASGTSSREQPSSTSQEASSSSAERPSSSSVERPSSSSSAASASSAGAGSSSGAESSSSSGPVLCPGCCWLRDFPSNTDLCGLPPEVMLEETCTVTYVLEIHDGEIWDWSQTAYQCVAGAWVQRQSLVDGGGCHGCPVSTVETWSNDCGGPADFQNSCQ